MSKRINLIYMYKYWKFFSEIITINKLLDITKRDKGLHKTTDLLRAG